MRVKYILAFILTIVTSSVVLSQNIAENDSSNNSKSKIHSPQKATIMSAVVPGLGQIYNHKIWKVPIVYAGIGTLTYFALSNQNQFNNLKQAYIDRSNGLDDPYAGILTNQGILNEMDRYRRYRDITIFGAFLVYILQIVDANVDAHLYSFDVSDDLSLKLEPAIIAGPFSQTGANGVKLSLNF
ncbi:MAG TPA: DUF5683 domain-containing protein [Bacteroidales bacterium]|nr:DUF5683 domain-containing protein [Bacteroidales bacterium]MDD4235311.1 DUF5683 domain-containing protein [Bacteroidales bacterium]HRW21099.1 DUF5683 domain-containing protein [Bacteroidales bacterium]HXK81483.1 DUF5683 domain-containing protein [Bacteroidales bacterium]